jgi:hypothetical protein
MVFSVYSTKPIQGDAITSLTPLHTHMAQAEEEEISLAYEKIARNVYFGSARSKDYHCVTSHSKYDVAHSQSRSLEAGRTMPGHDEAKNIHRRD